ncbi:MAG: hypothetical protein IPH34_14935 [Chitinophagaceae bacterium]|nr:hypothetical protein [Chitinophagaceae bacterium]
MPSGEFYLKESTYETSFEELTNGRFKKASLFYITEQDINELKTRDIRFDILQTFDGFNITMLNLKFLNKKTRKEELKKTYLIQLL